MRKMKIKDLSTITGISRNALSAIERGASNPSIKRVEKIAEALNCKIILSL